MNQLYTKWLRRQSEIAVFASVHVQERKHRRTKHGPGTPPTPGPTRGDSSRCLRKFTPSIDCAVTMYFTPVLCTPGQRKRIPP